MTEALSKELKLRPYEPRDIPRMIEVIQQYVPQLPNYRGIECDKDRIEYVLKHNIDNAAAFGCWVLCDTHDVPQGGVAGFCIMSLLSKDLIADDVFLFILPEYRSFLNASRLITTYREWAQARGAKIIRASHSGGSFPPGTKEYELFDKLLKHHGFRSVGTLYHYEPEKQ